MSRKYTDEMREFLAGYIPGHKQDEIAEAFRQRFGRVISPAAIKSYKKNNRIRSGTPLGCRPGSGYLWTPERREFVRMNNNGRTARELADILSDSFGMEFTPEQVKGIRARLHLRSGLTGCFEKGNVPPNKGKKGVVFPGSEKGWFQKGHIPYNKMKVGDEVVTTDGYVKVKVAEPNVWRFKHVLVWTAAHGEVPDGCMLNFKNNNKLDCSLENLVLVTRSEHSVMNHNGLRDGTSEDFGLRRGIARLKIAIKKRSSKK